MASNSSSMSNSNPTKDVVPPSDAGQFQLLYNTNRTLLRGKRRINVANKSFPLRSLISHDFVHIVVGPKEEDFCVNKELICHLSGFFQAALNGPFSEASSGIIKLPAEHAETFKLVYAWLYFCLISRNSEGRHIPCSTKQLVDLWVFGDKYGMPALCNAVVDDMIYQTECGRAPIDVDYLYSNVPQGSPLRRLTVAIYVNEPELGRAVMERFWRGFSACPEFLFDLSMASLEALAASVKTSRMGSDASLIESSSS